MTEVRCQMASRPATRPALRFSDLPIPALRPLGRAHGSPADARASARIPMLQVQPHPACGVMAGPASRSRLASRYPENREQRTADRPDDPPRAPPSQLAVPMPEDAPGTSVLCSLSSAI
jgi:hypothetical protein